MPVLFESGDGGEWPGYTANYIRVVVESDDILDNALRIVEMGESRGDFVDGTLVGQAIEVGA
jgi:hypothetical protein